MSNNEPVEVFLFSKDALTEKVADLLPALIAVLDYDLYKSLRWGETRDHADEFPGLIEDFVDDLIEGM